MVSVLTLISDGISARNKYKISPRFVCFIDSLGFGLLEKIHFDYVEKYSSFVVILRSPFFSIFFCRIIFQI